MLDRNLYLKKDERDIMSRDISSQLDELKKIMNDKNKMRKKNIDEKIHLMKECDDNDE